MIIEFIDLVKEVKEERSTEVQGLSFRVLPGVFSPIYSSDTSWFAEKITPLTKHKSFLEIGCGTGVIACLASIQGASRVVATDINPKAVENTRLNANLYSLDISTREGSIFDPIRKNELFDIIFWNHPFYYEEDQILENDLITLSVCDTKYLSLKRFFQEGKNHLAKDGQLILGSSNIARVDLIKKMVQEEGYDLALLEKVQVPVYKGKKVQMDLRIYALKIRC